MGCHTWFSNKLEIQPSYEEVREKYLIHLSKKMGYYERHIDNKLLEDEKFLFDDKTIENSKYCLSVLKRIYSRVEKRLCKLATLHHSQDVLRLEYCEKNNSFYKGIDGIHDIFRIGKYPDDELLSLEETLDFFEKRNNDIFLVYSLSEIGKDAVIEEIKKFWIKYPNGRIRFG